MNIKLFDIDGDQVLTELPAELIQLTLDDGSKFEIIEVGPGWLEIRPIEKEGVTVVEKRIGALFTVPEPDVIQITTSKMPL